MDPITKPTYDPTLNSWTDVSHAGMYYWTKDIVVDPNDATQNTWYVGVFSGWGGPPNGLGGLYKTTNRGTTWAKLTSTVTIDRVTSCTFDPNNANRIYMTTETNGLWTSANINSVTPTFSLVQSYPFQQPERVFFNPYNTSEMWVSSFGNGMKMGTVTVTGVVDFSTKEEDLVLYPNPVSEVLSIKYKDKCSTSANVEILDITGRKVYEGKMEGESKINTASFENGTYFIRITEDGKMNVKKFVVMK